MSGPSDRGLFAVIGAGVAVAAATVVLYFAFLAPRERHRQVQAEVEEWSASWRAARRCLVGDAPRSSVGVEAVVLRELTAAGDIVAELRACQPVLRGLRRTAGPGSFDAGADVEGAWAEIGSKLGALAQALAWRVSPEPNREPPALRRALGEGLAGLDHAYAALRVRVELGEDPPPGGRLPVLPEGRAIADPAGRPLEPREVRVGGDILAVLGEADGRTWLHRQDAAGTRLIPIGPNVVAAADGWGAWMEADALRAGPLDTVGDPASDGVVIARGADLAPVLAMADGPVRVVLYRAGGDGGRHWLARSRDGGATWSERILATPPGAKLVNVFVAPEGPRADLVWTDESALLRLDLAPGRLAGPLAPATLATGWFEDGPGWLPEPCAAGPLSWWQYRGAAHVARAGDPARAVMNGGELLRPWSCAGDRLLATKLAAGGTAHVAVCDESGCRRSQAVPKLFDGEVAAALGPAGPVVAVQLDDVAVLWTGDSDAALTLAAAVRLPEGRHVIGLIEWSGLSFIARAGDVVWTMPLPVRIDRGSK